MMPRDAFERLKLGLSRALADERVYGSGLGSDRRAQLADAQAPYAIILTCADSRVAPEYIFDAGLGDLFVCRNAGNVADEVVLGSIEFAASRIGCPLLVVLGHKNCGAVKMAVAEATTPDSSNSQNVDAIINRIMPAVILAKPSGILEEQALRRWEEKAVYMNVENVCSQILRRSQLLASLVENDELRIVGAVYDIASGQVEFMG
jgi:carbonic anhydrase